VIDSLSTHPAAQLVPASYAEKAMASLMQLHSELMDEKERRVDLFRRLMEREQALAELKLYVKVLEEKLAPPKPPEPVAVAAPPAAEPPRPPVTPPPPVRTQASVRPSPRPPVPPRVGAPAAGDGWRAW
jgi:hypothetical protein